MEGIDTSGLPDHMAQWATFIGIVASLILAAWAKNFGAKKESAAPATEDFAVVHGSIADMKPARELVTQVTLLVAEISAIRVMMAKAADEAEHRRETEEAVEAARLRWEREERNTRTR